MRHRLQRLRRGKKQSLASSAGGSGEAAVDPPKATDKRRDRPVIRECSVGSPPAETRGKSAYFGFQSGFVSSQVAVKSLWMGMLEKSWR